MSSCNCIISPGGALHPPLLFRAGDRFRQKPRPVRDTLWLSFGESGGNPMRHLRRFVRLLFVLMLLILFLQSTWAHRDGALPESAVCQPLLPLGITCEERLPAPEPLTDLQPGDVLVTFSTHTLGWRHGHAALVIDSETVLEAAMPGTVSGFSSAASWATYSSLLQLRVRDVPPQQQTAAAEYGKLHLSGLPYGFLCGFGPEKAPASPSSLQCAYLPWYAWQAQGIDLDSDGGRLVTVLDLARSPRLEVVQSRGPLPGKK